jgi:TolB protein
MVLTSYEDQTISRVVVGETTTHVWEYDFKSQAIKELLTRNRLASFQVCAGLLDDERLLFSALINGENRLFASNLDGSDRIEITRAGEGFVYGIHLSPDHKRVSYHITASKIASGLAYHAFRPGPYAINASNVDGGGRVLVAGAPGHLYFNPVWSPKGEWLAYLDCLEESDPAHFAAALCIGKPDGSEHRIASPEQSHWFGTSYGSAGNRGGGSNTTQWSPDGGHLLYTRLMTGSHADCFYDSSRPDHEELVYRPELARGGAYLCLLNPFTGHVTGLTTPEEGKWEHHAAYTQDGAFIAYGKAQVGCDNELWIMEIDGRNQRLLTRGLNGRGAWAIEYLGCRLSIPKDA